MTSRVMLVPVSARARALLVPPPVARVGYSCRSREGCDGNGVLCAMAENHLVMEMPISETPLEMHATRRLQSEGVERHTDQPSESVDVNADINVQSFMSSARTGSYRCASS